MLNRLYKYIRIKQDRFGSKMRRVGQQQQQQREYMEIHDENEGSKNKQSRVGDYPMKRRSQRIAGQKRRFGTELSTNTIDQNRLINNNNNSNNYHNNNINISINNNNKNIGYRNNSHNVNKKQKLSNTVSVSQVCCIYCPFCFVVMFLLTFQRLTFDLYCIVLYCIVLYCFCVLFVFCFV